MKEQEGRFKKKIIHYTDWVLNERFALISFKYIFPKTCQCRNVFNYKYKTLDKRKKLYKDILKSGLIFESKKLYENKVPDWIRKVLNEKNYQIDPKASLMLVEFLGTDLNKINLTYNDLLNAIARRFPTLECSTKKMSVTAHPDHQEIEIPVAVLFKESEF